MNPLQKNAIGVPMIFPLCDSENKPLDVSSATLIELAFKKPSGSTITKTAALVNDGTDGLVQYVTEINFLDQARTWQVQARIISTTTDIRSQISQFTVADNL